ncbi:MAG: hypothetical protein SFW36_21725 [Leptolyngbyaceae cyanobacterium bins.59]|nr:hypothetical protein [Leptolyngbyaceae cyanobacterium bins.59]
MNSDLQCFETAAIDQDPGSIAFYPNFTDGMLPSVSARPCSFTISRKASPSPSEPLSSGELSVDSCPAIPAKSPTLPAFKPDRDTPSPHQPTPSPALAAQLIQQMESTTTRWQQELDRVKQQIQTLYEEGPIVNGWLEVQGTEVQANPSKLRHLDTQHLMDYIEEICRSHPVASQVVADQQAYQLCGLDAEGQIWSYPCPPDQLQSVCTAISRYHRLRQLGSRKQRLEIQLIQIHETLAVLQKKTIEE